MNMKTKTDLSIYHKILLVIYVIAIPIPFGITFIYLGLFGGAIYWFVQSFILTTLMNSKIHSFWKFVFITFFAFGPSYYLYVNIIFLLQPLIILGFGLILFDFLNKIIGNNSYFLK